MNDYKDEQIISVSTIKGFSYIRSDGCDFKQNEKGIFVKKPEEKTYNLIKSEHVLTIEVDFNKKTNKGKKQ